MDKHSKPRSHVVALLLAIVFTGIFSAAPAMAQINQGTHLNPRGQSKVNKATAKGYMQSNQDSDGYSNMQKKSQVNIGSRKDGTCTMNVGTTNPGEKGKKEVIITSKDIINICK